jgi:hypothetical protein
VSTLEAAVGNLPCQLRGWLGAGNKQIVVAARTVVSGCLVHTSMALVLLNLQVILVWSGFLPNPAREWQYYRIQQKGLADVSGGGMAVIGDAVLVVA